MKRLEVYPTRIRSFHPLLIAILRVRNEELIIEDTLDYLGNMSDAIVCFDDASEDDTLRIIKQHPRVIAVVKNRTWGKGPENRLKAETLHRAALLGLARLFGPMWILCADADERIIGDVRSLLASESVKSVDVIRVPLYDAYMTPNDSNAIKKGTSLVNFRQYFGPERCDIAMIWRNISDIAFSGLDRREPLVNDHHRTCVALSCQHYGKALSEQHWEDTCSYYIDHFPWNSYGSKWNDRRGKAVHTKSDFGAELAKWGEDLFNKSVIIYP